MEICEQFQYTHKSLARTICIAKGVSHTAICISKTYRVWAFKYVPVLVMKSFLSMVISENIQIVCMNVTFSMLRNPRMLFVQRMQG